MFLVPGSFDFRFRPVIRAADVCMFVPTKKTFFPCRKAAFLWCCFLASGFFATLGSSASSTMLEKNTSKTNFWSSRILYLMKQESVDFLDCSYSSISILEACFAAAYSFCMQLQASNWFWSSESLKTWQYKPTTLLNSKHQDKLKTYITGFWKFERTLWMSSNMCLQLATETQCQKIWKYLSTTCLRQIWCFSEGKF